MVLVISSEIRYITVISLFTFSLHADVQMDIQEVCVMLLLVVILLHAIISQYAHRVHLEH